MATDADKVFKALADPGRRLLLDRLHAENGQTLGQLCEHLEMTRQAVMEAPSWLVEEALASSSRSGGAARSCTISTRFRSTNSLMLIGKFERGRVCALAELPRRKTGGALRWLIHDSSM